MFEWEVRVQLFQNSVAIAMCNRVGTEDDEYKDIKEKEDARFYKLCDELRM
jgi:hypothetical protein